MIENEHHIRIGRNQGKRVVQPGRLDHEIERKTAPSDVSEMAAQNRAFQIVLRLAKMQHLANTPQIRELLMLFRDTWRIRPGQVHVSHDCVREAATTWMVRNTLKPAGLLHGPP